MANGRVRRQHEHEAGCNAHGYDEQKIIPGSPQIKEEGKLAHTSARRLHGTLETPADISESLSPVQAAGHWFDPRAEQSRLFKEVRALRPYNKISQRKQSLIEDSRLQTHPMAPTQSRGCSSWSAVNWGNTMVKAVLNRSKTKDVTVLPTSSWLTGFLIHLAVTDR